MGGGGIILSPKFAKFPLFIFWDKEWLLSGHLTSKIGQLPPLPSFRFFILIFEIGNTFIPTWVIALCGTRHCFPTITRFTCLHHDWNNPHLTTLLTTAHLVSGPGGRALVITICSISRNSYGNNSLPSSVRYITVIFTTCHGSTLTAGHTCTDQLITPIGESSGSDSTTQSFLPLPEKLGQNFVAVKHLTGCILKQEMEMVFKGIGRKPKMQTRKERTKKDQPYRDLKDLPWYFSPLLLLLYFTFTGI